MTFDVVKEANHALRGPISPSADAPSISRGRAPRVVALPRSRRRPTVPPLPCRGASPQLTGTALDLLARATLAPGALDYSAARGGAGSITSASGPPVAGFVEREAVARVAALRPWEPSGLRSEDWHELAELILVLARFEQACRSLRAIQALREALANVEPTLAGYRAALVDERDTQDLLSAGQTVASDLHDVRAARRLAFGPGFALSPLLGGADADLIADGSLIDFKAHGTTTIVKRRELWQLAGYALADADDQYGIDRVGVVALRWRSRHSWPVSEFLERLAGARVSLAALRDEFEDVLQRDRSARPRPAARRRVRGTRTDL